MRHSKAHKPTGGKREASKAAGRRGGHARHQDAEGDTHTKGKIKDQKGRNTQEIKKNAFNYL